MGDGPFLSTFPVAPCFRLLHLIDIFDTSFALLWFYSPPLLIECASHMLNGHPSYVRLIDTYSNSSGFLEVCDDDAVLVLLHAKRERPRVW